MPRHTTNRYQPSLTSSSWNKSIFEVTLYKRIAILNIFSFFTFMFLIFFLNATQIKLNTNMCRINNQNLSIYISICLCICLQIYTYDTLHMKYLSSYKEANTNRSQADNPSSQHHHHVTNWLEEFQQRLSFFTYSKIFIKL